MSNRYMTQFPLTLEKQIKTIFAAVQFGASGAPNLYAQDSKGILSVTRNGTGDYTFVFGANDGSVNGTIDTYVQLLSVNATYFNTTAPAAPSIYISGDQSNVPGVGSVEIITNSAGTATDPGNGEAIVFEFTFKDSTSG